MAESTARMRQLHNRLVDVVGDDAADTLMERLPDMRAPELVTTDDLNRVESRLDERIGAVEDRLTERMAALEVRLIERIDGRIEASEQRMLAAMHAGFADVHGRFAEVHKAMNDWSLIFAKQTRAIVFSMIGAIASVTAIMAAVLGLG